MNKAVLSFSTFHSLPVVNTVTNSNKQSILMSIHIPLLAKTHPKLMILSWILCYTVLVIEYVEIILCRNRPAHDFIINFIRGNKN